MIDLGTGVSISQQGSTGNTTKSTKATTTTTTTTVRKNNNDGTEAEADVKEKQTIIISWRASSTAA